MSEMFPIEGVQYRVLPSIGDNRGWVCELFRYDELPIWFNPVMAYYSETVVETARGPHEHRQQTDYFCFMGVFRVWLWDNRPEAKTYKTAVRQDIQQASLIVPPGVVHAYRSLGPLPGITINCPDRLYRGAKRQYPVDEIRHELDPYSPFQMD